MRGEVIRVAAKASYGALTHTLRSS
jgi:hypothetical protein